MRRFCQLVSLRHSIGGGAYRFLTRLVPRLACSSREASRGYSLRLASRPVLLVILLVNSLAVRYLVSSGGSSFRLARRSSVFHLVRFILPRLVPRLAWRLVKQSVFSFCPAARLGGSWGGACHPSPVSFFFYSRLISLVASHVHDGGGSSLSSRCGVFHSRCPVVKSDWAMAVVDGRSVRRYEGRSVFISSFPPSGHRGEDDGAIWIRPQWRRTQ